MDALMPLASLPTQISGRNRAWRRMVIDTIRMIRHGRWRYPAAAGQPPVCAPLPNALVHEQQSGPASEGRASLAKTDEVSTSSWSKSSNDDATTFLYALELT